MVCSSEPFYRWSSLRMEAFSIAEECHCNPFPRGESKAFFVPRGDWATTTVSSWTAVVWGGYCSHSWVSNQLQKRLFTEFGELRKRNCSRADIAQLSGDGNHVTKWFPFILYNSRLFNLLFQLFFSWYHPSRKKSNTEVKAHIKKELVFKLNYFSLYFLSLVLERMAHF